MLSFRWRWFAAIITLALTAPINAQQQQPSSSAGAQRFTDATTKLIAAINADDQPAIQQLFNGAMREALPPEKTGPFFRGLLSAKGKLQTAGAPEVSGPAATVRVSAERGDWQFEITLDPSGKIAGLRVLPGDNKPGRKEEPPPATTQASDKETTYFDLRRSDDRTTRMIADRYFNLVRRQEWDDSTGKSKVMARYLEHDPELKWVKLRVVKGSGASRQVGEVQVSVDRLSVTCQSRVRQIATLQKRLDELVATADKEETSEASAAGRAALDDRGAPMSDEHESGPRAIGRERQRDAVPAEAAPPTPHPPAAGRNKPSAEFDDDPLGFAEIALGSGPPGVGGKGISVPGIPREARPSARNVDRRQWATDYSAFLANFTVSQDERGEMKIDWGELDELRTIGKAVANLRSDPTNKETNAWADRLGEVHWEAASQSLLPGEGETRIAFDLRPLPPPLQIEFILDGEYLTPDDWNQVSASAGNQVSFTGRLAMGGPSLILVYVRGPKPAAPGRGR